MLFNRARAAEYMRRCGLDVLVATSPTNITYFTDYFCWMDPLFKEYMMAPGASSDLGQAYAVFPLDGEPALVISPLLVANALDLWVHDLVPFGDPRLDFSLPPQPLADERLKRLYALLRAPVRNATSTDALIQILQSRWLAEGRIGLEMDRFPAKYREVLADRLPKAQFRDCSNLIRLVRAVKTDDEIQRLTRAATISEQALMDCMALARPGMEGHDLVEHYRALLGADGADIDHFTFGVRGMGFAMDMRFTLEPGDSLEVDCGCIYQRCFSDTGLTLSMGKPSDEMLTRYSAVRSSLDAGIACLAPGSKASAVNAAMWRPLTERGITASFPHGHGLGIEVRDYPILMADNGLHIRDECIDVPSDLPLEPGMVVNLEAAIRAPAVGTVHVEQTFVITDQGNRPLIAQNRARPFVAGTV